MRFLTLEEQRIFNRALRASGKIINHGQPPIEEADMTCSAYNKLRRKTLDLSELGDKQLGNLSDAVTIFREALPEDTGAVSVTRVWSRGNTLRHRLNAHDMAFSSRKPLDAAAPLPPLVAERLRDMMWAWKAYIDGEPEGRRLERARLGPKSLRNAF